MNNSPSAGRSRKVGRKAKPSRSRAVRFAISLPPKQAKSVRAAVKRGDAESISAYISGALDRIERENVLMALAAEMTAGGNKPTVEDEAWARRVLGLDA